MTRKLSKVFNLRNFFNKKAANKPSPSDVAELCKTNAKEAYEHFWRDDSLVNAYLEPGRMESYRYVVKYALMHGCGKKVADIGFGSGDFLKLLCDAAPEKRFEVYGLDYAEAAVKRAAKIIPGGYFLTGDVYALPYPADSFDTVFCIQTLEHLKEPDKVLAQFDKICKPGGMILITVPNGEFDDYEGHVNFWSPEEFKRFLSPRELIDFSVYNQDRALMAAMKPLKDLK